MYLKCFTIYFLCFKIWIAHYVMTKLVNLTVFFFILYIVFYNLPGFLAGKLISGKILGAFDMTQQFSLKYYRKENRRRGRGRPARSYLDQIGE